MAYINGNEVLFSSEIHESSVDVVQTTGDSETAVMSQKASSSAFANALKARQIGVEIYANDITPLSHELSVRVWSKNMIPFPYVTKNSTQNGLTFTVNDDGSVTVSGTASRSTSFVFANASSAIELKHGVTYTLSCDSDTYKVALAYKMPDNSYKYLSQGRSVVWNESFEFVHIYFNFTEGAQIETTLPPPQFEIGETATDYVPYVDVEGTTVSVIDDNDIIVGNSVADADGNITGLMSVYPTIKLVSDRENTVIECKYNRDTNAVIEKLTQAIISLGGTV